MSLIPQRQCQPWTRRFEGYPNVAVVNCETLHTRVPWKMAMGASFVIYEYTHFELLVSPPLLKEMDDDA